MYFNDDNKPDYEDSSFSDSEILIPDFATFDLESYEWIHEICCGFYEGKNYMEFWGENSVSQMLDYLFKTGYSGKIFAHAGGIFDNLFVMNEIFERNMLEQTDIIVSNGRLMKLSINLDSNFKKKRKIDFLDSYDLTRASLDKLCKEFKVKHKKGNLDRTNMQQYSKSEISPYLKNDVIGLHEVMTEYYKKILEITGAYPYLTIGSTSIACFMNKYKKYDFEVVNNDVLDLFLRQTLRGGRVEVFKTYGKNLYYYDINSLYPSVMIDNKYPVGKYVKASKHTNIEKYFESYCGFGKFKIISSPDLYIPYLSCRNKIDGKLLFPIGSFEDYFTFSEIDKALDLGYEIEFLGGYTSLAKTDFFNEFINDLYSIRKKSDSAMSLVIKLLLNNSYGKFAENKEREEIFFGSPDKDDYINGNIIPWIDEPEIFKMTSIFNKPYHNVGIGSQITAYARDRLYFYIEKVLNCGYSIYYCDTDSIITNCPPDILGTNQKKLGEMKIEDSIMEGIFIAPKVYAYERDTGYYQRLNQEPIDNCFSWFEKIPPRFKFVHKGFPKLDTTLDGLIKKYFNGELNKLMYENKSMCKFKEGLIRKEYIEKLGPFLTTKAVTKTFKSSYDKRILADDMINTIPLQFKNGVQV